MDKPTEILPQVLQALIEIIIRQDGELQEVWKEKEELEKKIGELEKASKRAVAPFRIGDKQRKEKKKQSGAKQGHKGHYRATVAVKSVVN